MVVLWGREVRGRVSVRKNVGLELEESPMFVVFIIRSMS